MRRIDFNFVGKWQKTQERAIEDASVADLVRRLRRVEGSELFKGVEGERFYFVHSYAARDVPDALVTTATHGSTTFAAAVERGVLAATQFHPEKSGDAGAQLLENWVRSL